MSSVVTPELGLVPQSFSDSDSDLICTYAFPEAPGSTDPSPVEVSYWVNGTTLQTRGGDASVSGPAYAFPYPRLSAVTQFNGTRVYLYNQINGSIISEHMYDFTINHWVSSNISIEVDWPVRFL